MLPEKVLAAIENETLRANIQKRPNRYLGSVGSAGLETLMLQTLDNLVALFGDTGQGHLQIELTPQQLLFSLDSSQPLDFAGLSNETQTPLLFLTAWLALSEQFGISFELPNTRKIYIYQKGLRVQQLDIPMANQRCYKLELALQPNQHFFGTERPSYFKLFRRCQQLAFLNSGLQISLTDGLKQKNDFCYQNGLTEYLYQQDERLTRMSQPLTFKVADAHLQLAVAVSKNSAARIKDTFVNGQLPIAGGTHYEGFIDGMVAALNQHLEQTKRIKYITRENFTDRFDFVLALKIKHPRYTGVFKKKIRNAELYQQVKDHTFDKVTQFLNRHSSWY
ncbi:hypothetical protein ACSFB8_04850 [Enterococcus faecalis]